MRTSIRLRLLTLTLVPALALLVFVGLQLRASLSLERRMAAATMEEVAAISAAAARETLVLAGVAVAALLLTVLLLVVLARGIVDPLRRLTSSAGRLAETLPEAVGAVLRGEEVGEDAMAATVDADLLERRDELGALAQALQAAAAQATTLAVDQARTRRGVAHTISDVARREQSLVERQLSLLEVMEDREEDPEQLAQLFKLDHLATRMRRNAENLLLLSTGHMPGSADSAPMSLVDVIRSAAAETEEYARVDVRVGLPLDVVGYATTPLSHLLAELIENATTFSPPTTRVSVTTRREGAGVVVSVVDRGLGLSPADLEEARRRIASPPLLEVAESRRLGLYVVGLLAQRLGVAVDLQPGDGAGLAVHVWLPDTLFSSPPAQSAGPSGLAAAVQAGGSGPSPTAIPAPHGTVSHDAVSREPVSREPISREPVSEGVFPQGAVSEGQASTRGVAPSPADAVADRVSAEEARGWLSVDAAPHDAPAAGDAGWGRPPAADPTTAPAAGDRRAADTADLPPLTSQALQADTAPDAFSEMQRLLDADPAAPPPLPDDVVAVAPASLPSRAPALPQRPTDDDDAGGLSLARASGGSTVDFDPAQVSLLMRSFTTELDFGPTTAPPPPHRPAQGLLGAGAIGAAAAPPPAGQPATAHATAAEEPSPATPPPATQTPPPANRGFTTRRTGGTSSWSTPFPSNGQAR